jgi:hypothetical protein
MDLNGNQHRSRVNADSMKIISAARDSCEEGARHVAKSREAIERSLRLLGKRFHQIDD